LNTPQIAAIAFLAALAAIPLAILLWRLAHGRMSLWQSVLWGIAFLLCKLLWRTRWHGWMRLPARKGAVIVCNHRASVDPFFVQTATTRKVHWMVAREYCEHPLFGIFLRWCEVIPVSRGGIDTAATKAAIRIVSEGGLMGMLPEGRINMTDELMLPVRPGAVLVALKARVPVVPCYIHGAPYRRTVWSPLFMPARVEVRVGEPIDLSEYYDRASDPEVLQEVMLRIVREIAALAGQPNFEPRIAGKHWKPTSEELEAAMVAADARLADQHSG
jgi:1-acyl-sn-glycerol-3-phosphate acyltransferase